MSTNTAVVSIVAIVSLFLLMGYLVHTTGSTAGLADLGDALADIIRAVADIIAAVEGHHR
jgi:divalent metal cation (Fe/Co/Zn/Cd) transporter